jgi:hypothetical protein
MNRTVAASCIRRGMLARPCMSAAALVLLCGSVLAQPAGVRVVNHLAAPGGNGQSWATAYRDLQDALSEAHSNPGQVQEIWVAKGMYRPARDHTVPGVEAASFLMRSGLAVLGGFAGHELAAEQRDHIVNITVLSGEIGPLVYVWHVVVASETDSTAVLDGFTVTAGDATDESPLGPMGGGIHIRGAATVRHCWIRGNRASSWGPLPMGFASGGGVSILGTGFFENCRFQGNLTTGSGGGVFGSGTFTACEFVDNHALHDGGGIAGGGTFGGCLFHSNRAGVFGQGGGAVAGHGTFTDCEFILNTAPGDAGAMHGVGLFTRCIFLMNSADAGAFGPGNYQFVDCHVEGNGGYYGFYNAEIRALRTTFHRNDPFINGAIDAEQCTFTQNREHFSFMIENPSHVRLVNCILVNNHARGVVRVARAAELEIIQSTIVGNTGQWTMEAAVQIEHPQAIGRVHNSILWSNGGVLQSDQIEVLSGSLDVQHSCIQGWTGSLGGEGNFGFDPVFADVDGRLGPGSACIDAGRNDLVPAGLTVDLDGLPRFRDDPGTPDNGIGTPPLVDMGAFEFQGATCYANCDQSTVAPILNVEDFTCFINRFAQGHPLANCDESTTPPVLTADDFTCFINRFAAGCP